MGVELGPGDAWCTLQTVDFWGTSAASVAPSKGNVVCSYWVPGYLSAVKGDRPCRQWRVIRGHVLVGAQLAWVRGEGKSRASQRHSSVKDRGGSSEILDLQSGGKGWFPFFFLQAPRENTLLVLVLHLAGRVKCTCKEVGAALWGKGTRFYIYVSHLWL